MLSRVNEAIDYLRVTRERLVDWLRECEKLFGELREFLDCFNYSDMKKIDNPDWKGFLFEKKVWKYLEFFKVPYAGNPRKFKYWKKQTGKGKDLVVFLLDEEIKVECKYLSKSTVLYPSWFKRDWLPREVDVYVTSYKENIPPRVVEEIKRKGRIVVNLEELFPAILSVALRKKERLMEEILDKIRKESLALRDLVDEVMKSGIRVKKNEQDRE